MRCPTCKRLDLRQKRIKGTEVVVDCCSKCRGVWFDADELNQVLDVASKELALPKEAKPTRRRCPRCQLPLYAFKYPQTYVEVDMCDDCHGLWLNPGEFKEIKVVRTTLERKGKLETHAPVTGLKGDVLNWINSAIAQLKDFG